MIPSNGLPLRPWPRSLAAVPGVPAGAPLAAQAPGLEAYYRAIGQHFGVLSAEVMILSE